MKYYDYNNESSPWFIISTILIGIGLVVLVVLFALGSSGSLSTKKYQYTTTDGEEGVARYCGTNRGTPYCRLEDGTAVYNIKSYKKLQEQDKND